LGSQLRRRGTENSSSSLFCCVSLFLLSKNMAECLIGIGSNLGDRSRAIDSALTELQSHFAITLRRVSRRHITQPIGGPAGQGAFINAAALVETSLSPIELLGVLQGLESRAGRTRAVRWGARCLDLDMLLYDDVVMNEEDLVLPHPRMAIRRFVLSPAAEIAPQMLHPLLHRNVMQLLEHLEHAPNYVAVTGVEHVGKSQLVEVVAARTEAVAVLDSQLSRQSIDSSPSPSLQAELEFLTRRCELLQGVASLVQERYVLSDFWLGQCLAYAKELCPDARRQVEAALLNCCCQVASPKLIVLVELELDEASPDGLTKSRIAIQRNLRMQLLELGQPPTLRLNAANSSWNEEEVAAAILAM
jgi:2-amino-4-hydroxy-6-hydroxymethyldihydropteridine diphosphokinase